MLLIVERCFYTRSALFMSLVKSGVNPDHIMIRRTLHEALPEIRQKFYRKMIISSTELMDPDISSALREQALNLASMQIIVLISMASISSDYFWRMSSGVTFISKRAPIKALTYHIMSARSDNKSHDLSYSEYRLMVLWMNGQKDKTLSQSLQITDTTISSHMGNIRKKLNVRSNQSVFHLVMTSRSFMKTAEGKMLTYRCSGFRSNKMHCDTFVGLLQ